MNSVFFLTVLYFLPCVDTIVGTHDAPIRCVEYCPEVNVMVTGSWDRSVRLWDPRTPCNAGTFTQPEKVELTKLCMKHSWANFYMFTFIKTKAHSDLIFNSDLKLKNIFIVLFLVRMDILTGIWTLREIDCDTHILRLFSCICLF